MKVLLQKKWFRILLTTALCILLVYILIYVDVILRGRSAYLEGEKYWYWYENPKEKQESLKIEFEREKFGLNKKLSSAKISDEEYDTQLKIARFNYERKLEESSIKYAYIWYQTVVELFSPPESKWVKLARERMPKAKELWKKELKEKNIPFEDYMLE